MTLELKGRSFLTLMDFSDTEIRYLLDLAHALKSKKKAGLKGDLLKGKNICLLFEKTSTRLVTSEVIIILTSAVSTPVTTEITPLKIPKIPSRELISPPRMVFMTSLKEVFIA